MSRTPAPHIQRRAAPTSDHGPPVDLVIEARWVVPIEPPNSVLEDHAVVVHAGRIHDVLPIPSARSRYRGSPRRSLREHLLIPGLVNAHTHAAMTLLRGVADDLPLNTWLADHIWPLERAWVDEVFVADGVDLALAEMVRGGVTSFNDMYFFPEVTAQRVRSAGMRASIGIAVIDFPNRWAGSADEALEKGLQLRTELRDEPLLVTVLAPHSPYAVSETTLEQIRDLATDHDCRIAMHIHETRAEVEDSLRDYGVRPLERLRRLGLLGPTLTAFHMTQVSDEEVDLLRASGTHVVHCPESNLKLASGMCPADSLLNAGVNVGLGTDGAASNNDLDMIGEMRTAALVSKVLCEDASSLPAHVALRMATLNGARALGLGDEIGSIEHGKSADLTAIDMGVLEMLPLHNPVSNLVYAAGRHQVTDVWVAGRPLLVDRELTTLDAPAIRDRCLAWRQRMGAGQA